MTEGEYGVRRAKSSEVDGVAELLSLAFMEDPVSCWVFPEEKRRRRAHPEFFGAFAGYAFDRGEVWVTEGFTGAVLWFPGGGEELEDEDALLARFPALYEGERTRFSALMQAMGANIPTEPEFLHAQFVGVLPKRQRAGIGGALLRHRLEHLDAEGIPSYLEASSPTSARLYRRLGFKDVGQPFAAPGAPPMWPMWHEPGS
jgi:ribosomal protein S18 acetylase RimI-like enzyme